MAQPVTQNIRSGVIPEESSAVENCLPGAARENPALFARLYDQHVSTLYKYLLGKTGSVVEAEDLTSQTFLSALENLPGYREEGNFRAWLFRIARNKWVDFYRKNKHYLPSVAQPVSGSESDCLHEVMRDEKSQVLAGLVRNLRSDEAELIRLRLVVDLEFREIAIIQNKSEAAVKKSYYRLIERMKKNMEQIYG